ncbi:MAG: FecR family protein, partial [Bacteroidales bacterium]|nr:FecR family protein [Bacteroidales bacterium]
MDDRLLKYLFGELDDSQRLQLLREINDDESLRREYIRLQNIFALTHLVDHEKDEEEARKSFRQFVHRLEDKRRREFIKTIGKIAAFAFVLITSTVFLTLHFVQKPTREIATNTLYVPAGQRAQLTLEDGTTVWLNAQSMLTYPSHFAGKERKVTLTGEAFFDVAKNSRKPFIVESQDIRVEVLGTQFNVYNYPDAGYFQASLVEGSVKISWNGNESDHVMLKPSQELVLQGGKASISEITNPNHFLWKDGIYCFENERLLDIIEKLQLYY